ncbi:MAG: endonuclease/exonuclease/phosphatase family protein [Phycisphaerae bacterium]
MLTAALIIASGVPFFVGALMCAAALSLSFAQSPRGRRLGRVVVSIGALLVAVSATPVVAIFAWAGGVALLAWLIWPTRANHPNLKYYREGIGGIIAGIALLSMLGESFLVCTPRLAPSERIEQIAVIGDSLSAGIEDGITVWPALLAADTGLRVQSRAQAGASLASALKQAEAINAATDVAMLLIGGNDLLWGRTSADFERELDALIVATKPRSRRLVIFELPTPPLGNRYVAAQRQLSKRHGVLLVPRWRLAAVLGTPGATTHGLHLSASGQRAVMDIVKWVLRADANPGVVKRTGAAFAQSNVAVPHAATFEQPIETIRVLTWNVCKCERGISRIADALRSENADIICLQELTEPRDARANTPNQTAELAATLNMNFASFGGPLDADRNQCITILTRWPIRSATRLGSDLDRNWGTSANVETPLGIVRVVSVHLAGTYKFSVSHIIATTRARQRDWRELLESTRTVDGPLIIAGDFNADARTLDMKEAGGLRLLSTNEPTFPAHEPRLRLDHVFAREFEVRLRQTRDSIGASDHRALVTTLEFRASEE